ncbi:hypothetical protein P7H17_16565 [Paenibacillus larvae]|nr:hypothetical protein [Paenibacillus larvae]MDT2287321.1 hypothetical protein [Paenibacillus larvae]
MRKGLRKSYTSRNYWNMRRGTDGLTTITVPKIRFKDGLPDDELEMAKYSEHTRTGGKPTLSQKTALMSSMT